MVKKVITANKVVDAGFKHLDSPEYRKESYLLRNHRHIVDSLSSIIQLSESEGAISTRDSIINITNRVENTVRDFRDLLYSTSGVDKDGRLLLERDKEIINQLFIHEGRAKTIKFAIYNSIENLVTHSANVNLDITKEQIPMRIVEPNPSLDTSWEDYYFKDMPAAAAVPILDHYINDAILTRLLLLHKIVENL